jgi:hypothetical protein
MLHTFKISPEKYNMKEGKEARKVERNVKPTT